MYILWITSLTQKKSLTVPKFGKFSSTKNFSKKLQNFTTQQFASVRYFYHFLKTKHWWFWNDMWQNLPKWRLAVLQYALPVLNKTGFDEFKRNLILGYTCVRPPDLLVHFCTSYRASDLRHKKFFYSMYQNALILMPIDF